MSSEFHSEFYKHSNKIKDYIYNFSNSGIEFIKGQRNLIKLFEHEGIILNIKSFKKPNLINKIIYRFFRKSKAKRSFEYATKLIDMKIGTPKPIAFFEFFDSIGLVESYYVCEHLENVFEFRTLVQDKSFKNREDIIRQFTKFTFELHQKGVEFLDHSPGNTLIKDHNNGIYSFYLVDLNRMKFHKTIDFNTRMKNLSHLTPQMEMISIMSNEYAKCSGEQEDIVFNTLWKLTSDFQYRFFQKKRIKKRLKFWKK